MHRTVLDQILESEQALDIHKNFEEASDLVAVYQEFVQVSDSRRHLELEVGLAGASLSVLPQMPQLDAPTAH
jgi:hypothetical protein